MNLTKFNRMITKVENQQATNVTYYWDCKYNDFDCCYDDNTDEYDEYYNCSHKNNRSKFCKLFQNKVCNLFEES